MSVHDHRNAQRKPESAMIARRAVDECKLLHLPRQVASNGSGCGLRGFGRSAMSSANPGRNGGWVGRFGRKGGRTTTLVTHVGSRPVTTSIAVRSAVSCAVTNSLHGVLGSNPYVDGPGAATAFWASRHWYKLLAALGSGDDQSRPNPRGGLIAWSSARSRSLIACNASASVLSCWLIGSASSQAAYCACNSVSSATASCQRRPRLRRSAGRRVRITGAPAACAAR